MGGGRFREVVAWRELTVVDKTYLAIIHLSNDTTLLSLSVTELFNNSIKQQGL